MILFYESFKADNVSWTLKKFLLVSSEIVMEERFNVMDTLEKLTTTVLDRSILITIIDDEL